MYVLIAANDLIEVIEEKVNNRKFQLSYWILYCSRQLTYRCMLIAAQLRKGNL